MKRKLFGLLAGLCLCIALYAQEAKLQVTVRYGQDAVGGATISVGKNKVVADSLGKAAILVVPGRHLLQVSAVGYTPVRQFYTLKEEEDRSVEIALEQESTTLNGVVVTGTMKAVSRLQSPISVEVYQPKFFAKNPTPSVFEAMQQVNGVRPQINCSVCNTGDIHINGLEGPYTMVTIDGMPIVSSLATVYGLFGLPTQLVDRVEVVKGPASGLYGSEAVGGLINIITKSADKAPRFSGQVMTTSWAEHNADLGAKINVGKHAALVGLHYFRYNNPIDKNGDNFTDLTLQHRVSVFNKWSFKRKQARAASLAGRYFWEDRWGGELQWNKSFRGGDSVYGEAINTKRWELIGNYQLPVAEKLNLAVSATGHQQRSFYGATPYNGDQRILFGQLTWDKEMGTRHSLLLGAATRYNFYDDNTTATADTATKANQPDKVVLPGLFVQDEWKWNTTQVLLMGLRYDHHPVHGSIWTPRIAWKWNSTPRSVLRLNAGTGFRVVNLFTEEHAALTGARAVEIREALRPEQSYNLNANYTTPLVSGSQSLNLDVSVWYSYFHNQIIPDYDTDPNKIIYSNLDGYAVSKGFSANLDFNIHQRLKGMVGATLQDVRRVEARNGVKEKIRPVLTEQWSATWGITYTVPAAGLTFDYTGNIYGPMRLPLAGPLDPRPAYSPVWSVQNLQVTKWFSEKWELFGGVKNLLNWTPAKNLPFLIARANDPFDKQVKYDASGAVQATAANPYALTFDPTYVFAPNQGRRLFLGIRYQLK
ncbi:TonB-dependent receptor [Cnuella takakiae]|nr:TonB-dependent receptor [Cnuella takakiae]OLY92252.1 TonB-dependent receptor [Cnuella takakiae]